VVPDAEILDAAKASGEGVAEFLREELPHCWKNRYLQMTLRPSKILAFSYGAFDYV
jgi:hypothetical protein